jgi:phosphopantetheinyl transferase
MLSGIELAVTRDEVSVAALSERERELFDRIRETPRASSWLKGRAALKASLAGQNLSTDTSALVFPHPRLSLSHSGELAIAASCDSRVDCNGIGVDFEVDRQVDPRMARFFLSDAEQAALNELSADSLLRLWTVKEAVFKSDPENAGTLLGDYELSDPAAFCGTATRAGAWLYRYESQRYANGWLSIAMSLKNDGRQDG